MGYTPIDEDQNLSLFDDQVNAALAAIASHCAATAAPSTPAAFMDWIDTDATDVPWYIRNAGNTAWTRLRYLSGGYRSVYCDDSGNEIEWGAAASGVTGYRLKLPLVAGTAGQSMRASSGDVTQLEWFTAAAGVANLPDLGDVFTSIAPTDGQVLTWDDGNSRWDAADPTGGGAAALNDLSDVTIASPASGHLLVRDATDFKNRALVAGDIPDLSATYLTGASVINDLANVSGTPSSGQLLRFNGSSWVPGTVTLAELAAHTTTANLLLDDQADLRLGDAAGSEYAALQAPATLVGTYTMTLPDQLAALDVAHATPPIDIGFLAVDSTGAMRVVAMNNGTGGGVVLSGSTGVSGSAGLIYHAELDRPVIDDFLAMPHTHDGSGGPSVSDGDGSTTLNLRYAAKLAASGGAPLPPEAGGTGLTSVPTGALLIGGADTTIPEHGTVASTENGGLATRPLATLQGSVTGQVVRWGGSAWAASALALDDLSDVTEASPAVGDFLHWNGSAWVGASDIDVAATPHFRRGLNLGGSAAIAGNVRFYEIGAAGADYVQLDIPGSISAAYTIRLPGGVPSANQLLTVASWSSSIAALQWSTLNSWLELVCDVDSVTPTGSTTLNLIGGDGITTEGDNADTIEVHLKVASQATGDMLYRAAGGWTRVPTGTNGQVLTLVSGVPTWQDLPA